MSRAHNIVCLILIAAGLGTAALLIPGNDELALLHFKDKEYEVARRSYEERLNSGDRSVDVIVPLTELYLQFGDVEKAVQLMEQFVGDNPNNLEALQRLGKLFQYAERPKDYLTILERLAALDPSEQNLPELSNIYNFTAQFDKQIAVLKALVEKYPAESRNFIDLARLEASSGSIADAEAVLKRFENLHPEAMTAETVELHLNLLLDNGHSREALAAASEWLKREPNYETVVQFADLMNFKKQTAVALRLIQPYDKAADTYPSLLREIVALHMANGESGVAYERLKRLHAAGKLPEIVVEPFLDLALARGEVAFAIELAQNYDITTLPNWLLAALAESALDAGQNEFLGRMERQLGNAFLTDQPVLGAQLAVARNDSAAALQWIDKAEKKPDLDVRQRLALANLYLVLKRGEDALRNYEKVALKPDAPDYVFLELANLYVDSGKAAQGLNVLEQIRAHRKSRQIETAWAVVGARGGAADQVLQWFQNGGSKTLSTRSLNDLYFAANEGGHPKLILAMAERLYQQERSRENQYRLALALTGASMPAESLKLLRALRTDPEKASVERRVDEEEAYLAALNAAVKEGEPVADELKRFWSARLAQSGLPGAKQEEIIYALLDLKDYSAVLPNIEKLARGEDSQWLFAYADICIRTRQQSRLVAFLQGELGRTDLDFKKRENHLRLLIEHGGYAPALLFLRQFADSWSEEWVSVYEEALNSLNRKADLIGFLRDRANKASLGESERAAMVNRLLELGDKRSAEDLLLKIAGTAAPGSPSVSQLLYLWGPRPPGPAVEWLAARGRAAPVSQRAAWMQHLINVGAASQAAGLATAEAIQDKSVTDAYIDALIAMNDRKSLGAIIRQAAETGDDPVRLRRLGRMALESEQTDAARSAFQKLLWLRPDDREAIKRLGSLALWEGNFSDARRLLSRSAKLGDADYETHFYLGEVLRHDHDSGARAHYDRALELLPRDLAIEVRILRAELLQRVGRTGESLAAFENVLRERPRDSSVRAEYAATLLEAGRYEDAKRIASAKQ